MRLVDILPAAGCAPVLGAVPLHDRFWLSVPDMPGDDCWEWAGTRNEGGYGKIYKGPYASPSLPRVCFAHRVSYVLSRGDIPPRTEVCHACDNPSCVNPSHLFLGSHQDNMRDAGAKGILSRNNAFGRRSHCPAGHAYDQSNTYYAEDNRCLTDQRSPKSI